MLHWHDAKALQLLDKRLRAGASAAATAAALLKLLSGQPAAAAALPALLEAVRLVCEWAASAPCADFGAALVQAAGAGHAGAELRGACGMAALLSERVLYALAALQALQGQQQAEQQVEQQAEQQAEQQQKRQKQEQVQAGQGDARQAHAAEAPSVSAQQAVPPLSAAISAWLSGCARDPQLAQQPWREQRLLHLALLAAEAGLLCPEAHLRSCLATGAFQPVTTGQPAGQLAGTPNGSVGSSADVGGSAAVRSFHLAVLEQLHPLLEYPSLGAGASSASGGAAGKAGGPVAPCAPRCPFPRQRFAWAREAVLAKYGPAATESAAAAASVAADDAQAAEWEALARAPTPGGSSSSESSSDSDGEVGVESSMPAGWQRWQDPALQALQQQLLQQLGICPANGAAAAGGPSRSGSAASAAPTASRSVSPEAGEAAATAAARVPFEALLARVRELQPWQQRHTAGALLAAAKAFLASTDSGGGGRRSPSPAGAAAAAVLAPATSGSYVPNPRWLLQSLALLRACGGHREALSLVSTCLNVLQRAVAAAVRAATAGQQAQQAQRELGEALLQAQQRWQHRARVSPALLLALLSAHSGSLAAADIAAKLLPMLTGGLWRLQQPQQQKAAQQSLAPQLELAAELLAMPGDACRQWLERTEQQHGSKHWVLVLLQQRAAALKAQRGGGGGGTQLQVQQAAAACLQAFAMRAQHLPSARTGNPAGPEDGASAAADGADGEQPDVAALLLQASPPSLPGAAAPETAGRTPAEAICAMGGEAEGAEDLAAALAAAQRSLAPAALPAVLQRLGRQVQGPGPDLPHLLLSLCPAASQALLADPRQAHAGLHHHAHLPGAAASMPAATWQLALALLASGAGGGGDALLRLNAGEAMTAAVAVATPATASCCWLLLRLLLDEQQRQGGHRLAEAERQLATRWVLVAPMGRLPVRASPLQGDLGECERPLHGPSPRLGIAAVSLKEEGID